MLGCDGAAIRNMYSKDASKEYKLIEIGGSCFLGGASVLFDISV
jgi:hypothetical protein